MTVFLIMKTACGPGTKDRAGRAVSLHSAAILQSWAGLPGFLVQPGVNTMPVLFAPILGASEDLHIVSCPSLC